MIGMICGLTLKQLLRQRRTWFVIVLAAIPVIVALLVRITGGGDLSPQELSTQHLLGRFIVPFVLPLTALIFGTAALGQEFEDGTSIYLLARPTPRWQIVAGKLLAAWAATAAIVSASVAAGTISVLAGEDGLARILGGFLVATAAGGVGYVSLFVCLSVITGRALSFGIGYVFLWEVTISALAPGTRYLSVREYTLAIAEALASVPRAVFDASLGTAPAVVLLGVLIVATVALAVRRLQRYQITSADS